MVRARSRTSSRTIPGHLDRQGPHEDAGAARLDEEDEGRIVGAQHDAQFVAQRGGAAAERRGRVAGRCRRGRPPSASAPRASSSAQAGFTGRCQRLRGDADAIVEQAGRAAAGRRAGRASARAAAAGVGRAGAIERCRLPGGPAALAALRRLGHGSEEAAPGAVQGQRRPLHGVARVHHEVGLAQHPLGVVDQRLDAVVADGDAEMLRRDVLELVRFVDHQRRALRDHFAEGVVPQRRHRRTAGDG